MPRRPSDRGRPALLLAPEPLAGVIEWYAPAEGPEGWLLCGRASQAWPAKLAAVEAVFAHGVLSGALLSVFIAGDDAQGPRFLALFQAPRPPVGPLRQLAATAQLQLQATASAIEDPLPAGARGRALLNNATAAGEIAHAIRAALPIPAWAGIDSLTPLGLPLRLVVDAVIQVPPGGIAIEGGLADPMRLVTSLALRQGATCQLLDRAHWALMPRPDLAQPGSAEDAIRHGSSTGFLAYAQGPFAAAPPPCLELELRDGSIAHLPLPRASEGGGLALIEQLLGLPRQPLSRMAAVLTRTIGPIARGLNRARLAVRPAPLRQDYGPLPASPERALIIPLHGRLDFMAVQLALFSARPDPGCEILYILDDPRLAEAAERMAQSCWMRFRLPFSLLDLGAHLGYAPANNAGLAAVRAAHICLLNADVFPRQGEGMAWLPRLCAPLGKPEVGAVGATLLFEDNTLQHAGMEYQRMPGLPPWPFPTHPGKGGRPSTARPGAREVSAVTGACLAIRRADLQALGGLDEDCIIADFEDAALCEALRARGLSILLQPDVVLYHLERQTPGSHTPWRAGATLVNASHFAARWNPDAQA